MVDVDSLLKTVSDKFPEKYSKLNFITDAWKLDCFSSILHITGYVAMSGYCKKCKEGSLANTARCPQQVCDLNVASSNFYKEVCFTSSPCVYYKKHLLMLDIEDNRAESGINKKLNFDKFNIMNDTAKKTCNICKKYAINFSEMAKDGIGLYLYGNPGIGKTHLVSAIGNQLLDNGIKVIFLSTTTLHNKYKALMNDGFDSYAWIEKLSNLEGLLILDDIGTEITTERVGETMYNIVNTRYDRNLPTIYTSNCDLDKLADMSKGDINNKIVDRIRGRNVAVEIIGVSYRKQELEKLLGD